MTINDVASCRNVLRASNGSSTGPTSGRVRAKAATAIRPGKIRRKPVVLRAINAHTRRGKLLDIYHRFGNRFPKDSGERLIPGHCLEDGERLRRVEIEIVAGYALFVQDRVSQNTSTLISNMMDKNGFGR